MTSTIKELFREDHISVSQINKYLMCPRAYKGRYIDRVPAETRSSALVFGSAIHEALAAFYGALKDGKPEPTLEEMMTVYQEKFDADLAHGLPVMFKDKESASSLNESANNRLAAFLAEAERPYRVVEVEMPWSIQILPGKQLVGILDAVVQDEDGTYRLLEHKTAARRWAESRLANDIQITAYLMTAPMLGFGDNAKLDIQVLLKTKKAAFEVYKTQRTDADKADLMETIEGVVKAVDAGVFYPCRDWWCGSCEFAAKCMAG